jgi:hypothetical protein
VIKVSSKEIEKPILKSITLSRSGDIQSGSIESISLEGFTGEYQTDDTYSFSFGDNGLEITKDMQLSLDVTFTGEDLTGKKI